MESSGATNKSDPLEVLSKEALIKKYNNLLVIAKKAKQAKDESFEELKKYKDNESKLSSDVAALKEVVESFNKKQNEFAEVQNKHKLSEEKNSELKKDFQKLEEKYAAKITECHKLGETLQKLSDKISSLEILNSEHKEKLNDFKELYAKVDIENKINLEKLKDCEQNEIELKRKLQLAEEKYIKLEVLLKEFQGKYVEECKNHEELQETLLKLQTRNSSGRCSSRSSDSLRPVYENQEYDELLEKCNSLTEENKIHLSEIENLSKKLNESQNLSKELSEKYNILLSEKESDLKNEVPCENDKLQKDLQEKELLINKLKLELEEKSREVLEQNQLMKEYENLNVQLSSLEKSYEELSVNCNENLVRYNNTVKVLNQCQLDLSTTQKSLEEERENNQKQLSSIKDALNERNQLVNDKSSENQKLIDQVKTLEQYVEELKEKLLKLEENREELLGNVGEQTRLVEATTEENKRKTGEIERLLSVIKENEAKMVEYEKAKLERKVVKTVENFSQSSNEEFMNDIVKATEKELLSLREENQKSREELQESVQKKEEVLKELESARKAYSSLNSKCIDLENSVTSLKVELETTTNALRSMEDNMDKMKEKYYCIEEVPSQFTEVFYMYLKEGNRLDAGHLIEDLIKLKAEVSANRKRIEKQDNFTQVNPEYASSVPPEAEADFKQKLSSLQLKVGEIKDLKKLINTEVMDRFNALQAERSRVMREITRNVSEVFYNLQNGNSELLGEMNDMNQVLKERGETISKLEQMTENQRKEIGELNSKISHLEAKLTEKKSSVQQMMDEFEHFKTEVEVKEKTIKELEDEVWKLKNNEGHAEALSSSTLTRVEEVARLMDVEESFEERYSKLKIFAQKLKKKVTEQQKQLEEERQKSTAKNNELQSKISNFQTQIKSLMNLQTEYDRLQDSYEEEKNDKTSLKKALETSNEKIDSLKQEVDDLKREKEKFLNDKISFENIKKKLSAQIISLKSAIEEEKTKHSKLEKEMEKVEHEKSLKEKKLEEEKEKHKGTVAQLEKQKMETKNLGVLKLEIAEYEKSVADLGRKLTMREEEIKELNCLLENQRSQCVLYLNEITHLKSQLTEENERALEANMQVQKCNQESSSREVEFKEKLTEIGLLKQAVENKKQEVEVISLELSKISQEKLKLEEKCKGIQDQSTREIHSLQDTVSNLQDSLSQRDLELSELKKEYEAYKIRAQSVLRQSQKEMNQSKQMNVMEELEQLRSTSDSLKARLEDSGHKMQKLVEENEVFQEEKNRLYSRIQELKSSLSDLRAENQELKLSKQKDIENHSEALRLQKLQSETLAHCFQKKIEELESKHRSQVDELNKEREHLQTQFQKILSANEKSNERREYFEQKRSSNNFVPVKSDKELLDVMLLEREECEGSESVDSVSPQTGNNTNLIPLDQLLNSSDNYDHVEEKKSPMQDLNQLNERLEKSENRIKHLTVLLSDAETDCARLQHLNDVLKEEIRRNQRNVEREQHAQNFEYMKNVVLKFISLHNVDERIRLVPVLNTILKLSPAEETILSNAARGVLENSNSNRGWGSYLNIWPSAQ